MIMIFMLSTYVKRGGKSPLKSFEMANSETNDSWIKEAGLEISASSKMELSRKY